MSTIHETNRPTQPLPPRAKRPLRICFVIDSLNRAGTELQLLSLLKHLDRQEIDPHLVLLDGRQKISKELQPLGIPVHTLGINCLCSYKAIQAARQFRSYLKEHQIDLVQTYFTDSTRFAAPIARFAGCTVFGTRRNIGHQRTASDQQIARFYNRCFIDKIITNAEAVRQAVLHQEKMQPDRVIVIPNAIELEPFSAIDTWQNQADDAMRTIGMVANLRKVKGIDLFIHAAAKIWQRHPNTLFQIAGVGDKNFYQVLINRLGMTSHVHLLGPIEAIPNFLETLDIAVLPSRAEGLSNALLEYMASGRPIVATEVGGNPELIEHKKTGLLVPPEDANAIANAIECYLEKPMLAEQLAIRARAAVTEKFAAETIARQYQEIYSLQLNF